MKQEDATRPANAPTPLSGARLGAALVWVVAVLGIYLAVREFGLALLH